MIHDLPGGTRSTLRWVRTADAVRLEGDVDLTNAGLLAEIVAVERMRCSGDVRLEMQDLSFMDGAGVRALLEIARGLQHEGRLLVLVSPGYIVRKALSVLTPEDLLGSIRLVDP